MKKTLTLIIAAFSTVLAFGQTAADVVQASDYEFTYLGIDYSHAKFIGDFSQFNGAGEAGVITIKNEYFDRWNNLVVKEQDKYNLRDMLRKENITYSTDVITAVNDETSVEEMEAQSAKEFAQDDVQSFINEYSFEQKEGIGVLFMAEYLNKNAEEGCFHVVIINMETKEILLHERIVAVAGGIGLRNYWARPIYEAIGIVKKKSFKRWKKEHGK